MLTVNLTPTMVTFKSLSTEQVESFSKDYELKYDSQGRYYYVRDTPQKLYKLLLDLTYDYDIELT